MARVFVNFRNGDDPFAAALIFRALAARFGPDALFRSSESIPPGTHWAKVIWDNHAQSSVLVAVIGPRWLAIEDGHGRRRLWQDDDWVRAEIATALRQGKLVIPVLVAGTGRFAPTDLPADLAELAELESVTLDHRRIDLAIEAIAGQVATVVAAAPTPVRPAGGAVESWLKVWNIPRGTGEAVDRAAQLAQLRAHFQAGTDTATAGRQVLLHGPLGTGKTQLAIDYARRFGGDYQSAWWISGAQPELIGTEFAALARAAGFAVDDNPEHGLEHGLAGLFRRVGGAGRWLLVFDGFDEPARLAPYLRRLDGGVDVLITSRHRDWGMLPSAVQSVGPFTRPESVALLSARLAGQPVPALDRLAAALDDIPVALAQSASFLAGAPIAVDDYVDLLATRGRELLARGRTYDYPDTLAAAWSLAVDGVAALGPAGVELLELGAVCGPAVIPLDLFPAAAPWLPPALAATVADPIELVDLVAGLTRSGLVSQEGRELSLAALLQTFLRQGLGAARLAALRETAARALARISRGDPRDPAAWDRYGLLLPHVLALDLVSSPDPAVRHLLLDAVRHLVVRADAAAARDLAAAALSQWRAVGGPDEPLVLDAATDLAQAHFRLGDYRRAAELDSAVLAARRRLLGDDDPGTLAAAHNLAMDRLAVDDGRAAGEALLVEVVRARCRILGEDHPQTLRSVHNLAFARRSGGDFAGARELDAATYPRLRSALGPDHPDTLLSAAALALDLRALDEPGPALLLEQDAHQRLVRLLGADHPDTLRCGYGVAVALRSIGETGRAAQVAADVYARRRRVLGENHRDTLRSGFLAGLLLAGEDENTAGVRLRESMAEALRALAAADVSTVG